MRHVLSPLVLASYLGWSDVAPSRRPVLDLVALEPTLHAFVVRGLARSGNDERALEASIDRWLIEEALFVQLPAGAGPWLAQDIELAAAALVPRRRPPALHRGARARA